MPQHAGYCLLIAAHLALRTILGPARFKIPAFTISVGKVPGAIPDQSLPEKMATQLPEAIQCPILFCLGGTSQPDSIIPEILWNLCIIHLDNLGKHLGLLHRQEGLALCIAVHSV